MLYSVQCSSSGVQYCTHRPRSTILDTSAREYNIAINSQISSTAKALIFSKVKALISSNVYIELKAWIRSKVYIEPKT